MQFYKIESKLAQRDFRFKTSCQIHEPRPSQIFLLLLAPVTHLQLNILSGSVKLNHKQFFSLAKNTEEYVEVAHSPHCTEHFGQVCSLFHTFISMRFPYTSNHTIQNILTRNGKYIITIHVSIIYINTRFKSKFSIQNNLAWQKRCLNFRIKFF